MKKSLKKVASFALALIFVLTTNVYAGTILAEETKSEKIMVEVLVDNNDENFAENIVFDDGTRLSDYDYTVKHVIQPRGFYPIADYFDYAAWITRDGVRSLSIDPKTKVRTNSTYKNDGWRVLSSTTHGFGSSPYWKNTQVMKWQYDCHYSFAANKDYWNLEPHRTASSYAQVVLKACNP